MGNEFNPGCPNYPSCESSLGSMLKWNFRPNDVVLSELSGEIFVVIDVIAIDEQYGQLISLRSMFNSKTFKIRSKHGMWFKLIHRP